MSQEVSLRGTGRAIFAGRLLIIGGVLWLLQGLAGIVHGSSYIKGANTLITTSAGTWGWIHLIGGSSVWRPVSESFLKRPGRACSGSS